VVSDLHADCLTASEGSRTIVLEPIESARAMKRRALARIVCLSLISATAAPLYAQSLADLSRKEEERRKTVKEPSKVYTNKDLPSVPSSAGASSDTAAADEAKDANKAPDAAKDEKSADAKTKDKEGADKTVKDQAYWSSRLKELQTRLEHDEDFSDALQTRINSLTADFVNRDDPAQRAAIGANRDKSVAELDRLKLAIEKDRQAIADLQEEARRAGVPPGWLR
jgi:hypothetical protein